MADFNPYSDSVAILFDNGDIILERNSNKRVLTVYLIHLLN